MIYLVDDDESLRTAVGRVLRVAGYDVRAYGSAGEFLLAPRENAPSCLLLDVRLPGPSGLELQEALTRREETMPVIFLTGHGDIPMSVRAMKAGAMDFLTKPVKKEALLAAVKAALARAEEQRIEREHLRACRACFEALTPREREVFERVVSGKLNKEIAAELGTAERTVKAHRAHVMEKMHAASLAQLVHIADRMRANGSARVPG